MARRPTSSPTDNGTQRRRPGRKTGRRAALLAAALALLVSPAATADTSFVPTLVDATVFTSTGPQAVPVTEQELDNEVPYADGDATTMEQYDPSGVDTPAGLVATIPPDQGTWPLSDAVTQALSVAAPGSSVSNVKSIVVFHDDNSPESPLSPLDVNPQSSDFANPSESPVITDPGDTVSYYRPRRPTNDANAVDAVDPNSDQNPINSPNDDDPIDIQIFLAQSFTVTISAPTTSVLAGGTLTFGSTPAADDLNYYWTVGGQTVATGEGDSTQTLPFTVAGSYQVGLEVTDPSTGEIGGAAPVTVTVNGPSSPTATTTTPSGTSTLAIGGNGSAASGPSQSPVTSPSASPGTQVPPRSTQSSGVAPPGSTASGTTARAAVTATTPVIGSSTTKRAGAGPAASGSSSGAGATGGGGSDASGAPRSDPSGAARTSAHAGPSSPSVNQGASPRAGVQDRVISGLLISGVDPSAVGSRTAVSQLGAGAHAPALAPAGHRSWFTPVGAGLGVLLLFSVGIGQELRGLRVRNRHNRPRAA